MRFALPLLAVLLLLAGCVPESAPKLHDVYVYGTLDARLSYLYGSPGTFLFDGSEVTLSEGSLAAPYAVDGALLIDDKPYVRRSVAPLDPPAVRVSRIPLTTDLQLAVERDVGPVVYFDGQGYFALAEAGVAGTSKRVVPRPRLNRLRGLGLLSDREADALADALERDGSAFAVAVLPRDALPAHNMDGLGEYLATGVYVQSTLATDESAFAPAPQQLPWEVLAQGQQAVGFDQPHYALVSDEAALINLWNQAHGSQLTLPPVPNVDFGRETVLALFAGQKPSGGYGVDVRRVSVDNGELYVDLSVSRPAQGAVTTQALTSPWVMIRVLRGGFGVAWLRDPQDGSLLGVARRAE